MVSGLRQAKAEQKEEPAAHRQGGECAGRGQRPFPHDQGGEQSSLQRGAAGAAPHRDDPGSHQGGEQREPRQPRLHGGLQVVVVRVLHAHAGPGAAPVAAPPAVKVARVGAGGAVAVEAESPNRMGLDHGGGARRDQPVGRAREMGHLGGEHRPEMVERRRPHDRRGGDASRQQQEQQRRAAPQRRQHQRHHHEAKTGEQQRHALPHQHHQDHGGSAHQRRREHPSRRDEARARRHQHGKQQARQGGCRPRMGVGAGERPVAEPPLAVEIAPGRELLQRLRGDVGDHDRQHDRQPAPARRVGQHPPFEGGREQEEAPRRDGLGERVPAAMPPVGQPGGGAEDEPGPPGEPDPHPRGAQPAPVARARRAEQEQGGEG